MLEDTKTRNDKLVVNIVLTFIQTIINYGISFLFTPYLISVAGSEAYGFVNLANNMVNYAAIITVALNSVAGRYITISIHKGKEEEGNQYYNSVIWTNIILAIVTGIVFIPIILNIGSIFDVPYNLIHDVKLLFMFIVLNFMVTIISNVFTVGAFVTNQIYLTSIGNCLSSLLRVILLIALFGIFPANVAFVGLTSFICSLFLAVYNGYVTLKLDIGLSINIKIYSLIRIKELFFAGIWSSVTKLSQILSDGLDLLISNMAINASAMGDLSVAYTVPTMISGLIGAISGVFSPQQTYYYAKDETDSLVNEIKLNMKIMGFFVGIILVEFIVYGRDFYSLWTPNQNINLIYELSIITCTSMLITGVTSSLNNVFLVTNNLKINSLFYLGISFFDAILALFFVKFTGLGIYAVAGVSKVVGFIVNITYVPLFAAKCLNVSWKTFYPIILKYFACIICLFIFIFIWKYKVFTLNSSNWIRLIINIGISSLIAMIANFYIFLTKDERQVILKKIKNKI